MKSIYFENDDILQIRISAKPIMREISQGWNTNISYAEDGSIVWWCQNGKTARAGIQKGSMNFKADSFTNYSGKNWTVPYSNAFWLVFR